MAASASDFGEFQQRLLIAKSAADVSDCGSVCSRSPRSMCERSRRPRRFETELRETSSRMLDWLFAWLTLPSLDSLVAAVHRAPDPKAQHSTAVRALGDQEGGVGGGRKVCVARGVRVAVVEADIIRDSHSSRRTTVASKRLLSLLDDDSVQARRSAARRRVLLAGIDSTGISDILQNQYRTNNRIRLRRTSLCEARQQKRRGRTSRSQLP